MRPRKRFGQHFLRDEGVLRRIADAMEIRADDEILEIGPGDGALTAELLRRGGRVRAVEIDRDLCAKLRVRFAEEARAGRLRLTEGDALREDFSEWEKGGGTRVGGKLSLQHFHAAAAAADGDESTRHSRDGAVGGGRAAARAAGGFGIRAVDGDGWNVL